MASPYAMDLGNILGTVDSVRTARMQREQMALQREQFGQQKQLFELGLQDRQRELQDREQLRGARGAAASGDVSALWSVAPQEAIAIQQHFRAMSNDDRTRALQEAQEATELQGKMAAYVLAGTSPQEQRQRYMQVRQNLPEEARRSMPAEFSEEWTNFALARTAGMDHLLGEIARGREVSQLENVLAPQGPGAPRGQQGSINPTANPQGLPEGIIAAVDTVSPLGNALAQSESGGRFSARNNVEGSGGRGHYGRGQFSIGRMQDYQRATGKQFTPDEFMANPDLQQEVEGWHRDDILRFAQREGLYGYVGREINGIPVTEQGLVNVAHLGGKEGLRRFLESGGEYDVADKFGTRLSEYLALGAQDAMQAQADPRNNALAQPVMMAMASPDISEPARAVLGNILARVDPGSAPQPELMNLSPGSTVFNPATQEPVFTAPRAEQGGFRNATPEEAAQYGAPAGQFGPDGRFYPINPPSGMAIETTPEGGVRMIQGPNAKFTEAQSKDNVFATRARGALVDVDQYGTALTSRMERAAEMDPTGIAREMQSEEFQVADNAAKEFLAAILRKDTGAAITEEEIATYGSIYLPRPGDTPAVLQRKQAARARAVAAIEAGMSADQMLAIEKVGVPEPTPTGEQATPPTEPAAQVPEWMVQTDPTTWTEEQILEAERRWGLR